MNNRTGFHVFLFIITFISVTFPGQFFEVILAVLFGSDLSRVWAAVLVQWPYSVGLMGILLCHEMGHYIPARLYGVRATLPYFIPSPFYPIGTMGAVIRIQDPIPDKKKLFDIGVGGPFMSLILSIPCWIYGVYLSKLAPFTEMVSNGTGRDLIFGESLFTFWSGQWILGPFDPSKFDIVIHPLAMAGWVGLLVTAFNMLPFGQLDGGHIIYSMFGEKYRKWIYHLFICFTMFGLVHFTWLLWAFIIYYFVKVEHPFVPDPEIELDNGRKILGYFMFASLIFIFVPFPIRLLSELNSHSILGDIFIFVRNIF